LRWPESNPPRRLAVAAAALALVGCTTFSADGGFGEVERIAKERLGKDVSWQRKDEEAARARAEMQRLLAEELSAGDAVQIALLNNPGLQASYAALGIAEADLVQAGRIANPRFAYLRTSHGDERKLEWALTFPIIELLTIPLRTKIEDRRFAQAKLEAGRRVLEIAAETRRAYYRAVAAQETARYMAQVQEAAEAAAELARRMARAGNIPKITELREQVFSAEAAAQLARARQAATAEREWLTRLMGLYGEDLRFKLPERLPDLPASAPELQDAEQTAVAQRLDIQAARRESEGLAESLGLTKATRFINALELGPAQTKEDPEPWKRGYELSLEVPLFDWGSAKVARAESLYMQSIQRIAETAVNARSEVREAYSAQRIAYETAKRYRDEIVPLRKQISEESLLRYNAMLASVFELLADSREQIAAVAGYIDSLRDYWVADAELQAALSGGSAGRASPVGAATTTAARGRGAGH
jgi:outer membrane protein TolC